MSSLFSNATRRKLALPGRDVEIALIDWGGDGPLALLHHANGFCAGMWALLAERLRPHYRVVALDARGHGDSTAPPPGEEAYEWMNFVEDLIPVAEHLADEQGAPIAYGIGNSFGGLVTAYAAGLRPDLFERLAMLDPVIRPPEGMIDEIREKMPLPVPREDFDSRGNPMAEAARRRQPVWPSRDLALEKWQGKAMFESWDPRALRLYVDEGMRDREDGQVELKCNPLIEACIFDASGILDIFEVAERIEAPTLILRAGRGYFPMAVYQEVVERAPDAKLLELDIDHLMPMHNPPELAEVLLDFGGVA
ncbi:MAG: alpha/beta hydrolase [Myxococcota bacterium]|nr:alpha/beta hydrolase [Myxococcota bacterium]